MTSPTHGVIVPVSLALAALVSSARAQVPAERSVFVVDERGAHVEHTEGTTSLAPAPTPVLIASSGPLWSLGDAGEGWVARAVSIGDHGGSCFTEFDTAADRAEILSTFDTQPLSPLLVAPQPMASQDAHVDSAEDAPIHVACRQIPVSGLTGPRNTFVSCYDAVLPGSAWTYQFPIAGYGPAYARVSRDGTRVVAGMLDTTGQLHLRVFGSSSSVPTYQTTITIGPQMRAFLLSADGTKLYIASGSSCQVWDVDQHVSLCTFVLMTSLDSHAISGDGSVFTNGGFNTVNVYERQAAGNYAFTHQMTVPGQAVCTHLALSEDGSTIAAGFNLWDTNLGVRIQALDVPSKTVTMTDVAVGAGTLQNVVADVAISADGSRFVVGLWGDEAGLVDDLRVYRRDANAPIQTHAYPGSIYAVDMSADGSRVIAGSKAVHANQYAGGGSVDVYAVANEDFAVTGVPGVGDKLKIRMTTLPGAVTRLVLAPGPAPAPFQTPYGFLFVDRFTMWTLPLGVADLTGLVAGEYTIPTASAGVGSTLCLQGLTVAPRLFTRSWARMTVLP